MIKVKSSGQTKYQEASQNARRLGTKGIRLIEKINKEFYSLMNQKQTFSFLENTTEGKSEDENTAVEKILSQLRQRNTHLHEVLRLYRYPPSLPQKPELSNTVKTSGEINTNQTRR